MTTQVWLAIFSSSLLASAITGFFSLRAKKRDYVDDYFRKILARRLEAYNLVEVLIFNFKVSSPDSNGKLFHHVFNTVAPEHQKTDNPGSIVTLLLRMDREAFWLSDEIFQKSREISNLLLLRSDDVSWITFGTEHYKELASIRVGLERLYSRDLRNLHDVPKFLKSKRHIDTLQEIRIEKSNFMKRPSND